MKKSQDFFGWCVFLSIVVIIVLIFVSCRSNRAYYNRLVNMPTEKEVFYGGYLPHQIREISTLEPGDIVFVTRDDTLFLSRKHKSNNYYLSEIYVLKDNHGHKWTIYQSDKWFYLLKLR